MSRTEISMTGAVAARDALQRGDVSAEQLATAFLDRIAEKNPTVGAVRQVQPDRALAAARAIDQRRARGEDLPPLAGLPVLVKENCDIRGLSCSAGLSFRAGRIATADSAIATRHEAAGAVVLGTTVSDPGAFGVRTAEVTNPLDARLTVGGSSGGSAAALAAGFCLAAIGTDTGGSIRIPSACCGTTGLKPTFDRLTMEGIFPLVPSLDHVGPMAHSIADVDLLWAALAPAPGNAARPESLRSIGYDPAWLAETAPDIADAFITCSTAWRPAVSPAGKYPCRISTLFRRCTDVTALFERALNIAPVPVTVQITCEIRQLEGASYNKRVVGPGR